MRPTALVPDTRTQLLAAGARLYGSSTGRLLGELKTGAVADEAGFHRQTFYRYWETHEQYVDDLVTFILDPDDPPRADGVVTVPNRREAEGATFTSMAIDIARYDFERLRTDPSVALKARLWSLRSCRPDVGERLEACHRSEVDMLTGGYEALFERWGREPRPPFTCSSIARLLQGLLHGMVAQPEVAGGPSTEELYADAVAEFLISMCRPAGAAEAEAATG